MKKLKFILPVLPLFMSVACCSIITTITNKTLNERLLELENRQNAFEKKTNEMEQEMGEMEDRMGETRMVLQNITFGVRNQGTSVHVAFSTLFTHVQTHIGLGQTIKFDKVLLNDGSGYNSYSGMFTAPVSGVYLFWFSIGYGGNSPGQVWMELMQNNQKVNGAVTDSLHSNQDLQGGNLAIIRAQMGDMFWIQSFHQSDARLFGDNGFTSFSGVLLY